MLSGRELRAAIASLVIGITWSSSALADERQSLEELRNTVINLLQALVDQGVISKEKASLLVKQAQDKAAADAAALAKADEGAVRVPYVPQIVKDEISKQVAEAVKPAIVADVVKEAKDEKWGVPGALPDWLSQIRVSGSLLFREEGILYSGANQQTSIITPSTAPAALRRRAIARSSTSMKTAGDFAVPRASASNRP